MRGAWEKLIGKTIQSVVVVNSNSYPERQVFVVFDDDTHFEFYGSQFRGIGGVDVGDLDYVVKYVSRTGAKVQVIQ